MSIIGHAIQNAIANVHSVLKQQSAGLAAQSEEEARRIARVEREEQEAREAVRETHQTQENPIAKSNADERRGARSPRNSKDGEEAVADEKAESGEAADQSATGANIDLFA